MRRYNKQTTWKPTAMPVMLPAGTGATNKIDYTIPIIPAGDVKANEAAVIDVLSVSIDTNGLFSGPTGTLATLFLSTPTEWAAGRAYLSSTPNVAPQGLSISANPSSIYASYSPKFTNLAGGLNAYLRYWFYTNTVNPTGWRGQFIATVSARIFTVTEGIFSPFRDPIATPVPATYLPAAIP